MKTTLFRLYLVFSLIILFSITLIFSFFFLEGERRNLYKIRKKVEYTLSDTRQTLLLSLNAVVDDPSVQYHLKNRLNYSIKRSFLSKLKPGYLDQIVFFNTKCKKIFQSGNLKIPEQECPSINDGEYRWIKTEKKKLIKSAWIPIYDKFSVRLGWILGSVEIDTKSWWKRFPHLKKIWDSYELTWQSADVNKVNFASTIWSDRYESEQSILVLTTNEWTKSYWQFIYFFSFLSKNSLFFLCLLLLFLFLNFLYLNWNIYSKYQSDFLSLESWTQQIFTEDSDYYISQYPSLFTTHLQKTVHNINNLISQKDSKLKKHQELLSSFEKKMLLIEKELEVKEDSYLIPIENESTSLQVASASPALFARFQQRCLDLEKSEKKITEQLIPCVSTLNQLLDKWKKGIKTKGSRKFLRSLSETETQDNNSNQLDDELFFINSSVKMFHTNFLQLENQHKKHKYLQLQESLLFSLWNSSLQKEKKHSQIGGSYYNFLSICSQIATHLRSPDSVKVQIHLNQNLNKVSLDEKISTYMLFSIIYHALMSLISLIPDDQDKTNKEVNLEEKDIHVDLKFTNNKKTLLLKTKNLKGIAKNSYQKGFWQHTKILEKLITRLLNGSFEMSPQVKGQHQLIISWES